MTNRVYSPEVMSMVRAPERRRRRWLTAAFALFVVAGLQLAAMPPVLFAGSPGECVMSCAVEGRSCCCKGAAGGEPAEPHTPEAEADGRLSSLRPQCRELCATFDKAPSDVLWFLAEARRGMVSSMKVARDVRTRTPFRCLDHADPSTLPRPPPAPVAFS